MSKIVIKEDSLKKIILESIESVLKESSYDRLGNFNSESHNTDIINGVVESVSVLLRSMDKSIFNVANNKIAATDDELKNRLFILYKVLNKAHEDISNALRDFQN